MAKDDQMLAEHQRFFSSFVKFSTYSGVVIAIILLLMAAFLV